MEKAFHHSYRSFILKLFELHIGHCVLGLPLSKIIDSFTKAGEERKSAEEACHPPHHNLALCRPGRDSQGQLDTSSMFCVTLAGSAQYLLSSSAIVPERYTPGLKAGHWNVPERNSSGTDTRASDIERRELQSPHTPQVTPDSETTFKFPGQPRHDAHVETKQT